MAPSISLSYCPSDEEAERFWQAELQNGKVSTGVPDGFPQKLRSSFAWKGADIEDRQSEWQLDLTSDEIDSVNAALAAFEGQCTRSSKRGSSTNSHQSQAYRLVGHLGVFICAASTADPASARGLRRLVRWTGLPDHPWSRPYQVHAKAEHHHLRWCQCSHLSRAWLLGSRSGGSHQ